MAAPINDFWLELGAGDIDIVLNGTANQNMQFDAIITNGGVQGLYGTPTSKTSITEKQTANGAHDVADADILYSARTVTIPIAILQHDESLDSMRARFGLLTCKHVRLTVHDRGMESYLTGFLSIAWSGQKHNDFDTGTLTLTCADPVRYSLGLQSATLLPTTTAGYTSADGLGLYYGKGGKGLYYPIRYGAPDDTAPSKGGSTTGSTPMITAQQNVADISNSGNTTAYPTLTLEGRMSGVRIDWTASDGSYGTIGWKGITSGVPAIFDSKTHAVTVNNVDQSYLLTYRSFPHVPAHGSCRIALISGGYGDVKVTSHDTWIS